MTTEQEERETFFEKAEDFRSQLIDETKLQGRAEVMIPPFLAAIILRFPQKILKKSGILMIPKKGETKIVVSEDRYYLLEQAFAWANEDEEIQSKVLANLYYSLFQLGQASMTSGVDTALILRPHRALIELHAEQFPPLKGLMEFVEGGSTLTDVDKENLAGVANYIFVKLKAANYSQIEIWEGRGLTPENMFLFPDE